MMLDATFKLPYFRGALQQVIIMLAALLSFEKDKPRKWRCDESVQSWSDSCTEKDELELF